jgi:hypothetical protein
MSGSVGALPYQGTIRWEANAKLGYAMFNMKWYLVHFEGICACEIRPFEPLACCQRHQA